MRSALTRLLRRRDRRILKAFIMDAFWNHEIRAQDAAFLLKKLP